MGAGALLDEPRICMDGLSDESGAAAPLAMAIKQLGAPVASEVSHATSLCCSRVGTCGESLSISSDHRRSIQTGAAVSQV